MSNTAYLDEVINQSVDLVNIGSNGWIQRYMSICQMIVPKTFKRRWVLFKLLTALKKDLSTVAVTNSWTQEQVDDAKAILNFPLRLYTPEVKTTVSNPFPIASLIISIAVSGFLSAMTFLFTQ